MKMIRFLLLLVFVVVALCVPESVSPLSYNSVLVSPLKKSKKKKPATFVPPPTPKKLSGLVQLPRKFKLPSNLRFAPVQADLFPRIYKERGIELYAPLDKHLTASVGAYTLSTNLAPPNDPLASQHAVMVRFTVPF